MTVTVYFDLDGTLLDYTTPFPELFSQTLPTDATDEMAETYSETVLDGIDRVVDRPYERAFDAVRTQYDLDIEPDALATAYIENEATATDLSRGVRRLVAAIAAQHQTGILTNGDGRMQRRKLEEHGLGDLVDTVIVSNEIGARKPSQAIFEEAMERLPADEFLYIGDSLEEDIVPAREAGFSTVYIDDTDQLNTPITAGGTEELATVLLPLLGGDSYESSITSPNS